MHVPATVNAQPFTSPLVVGQGIAVVISIVIIGPSAGGVLG